MAGKTPVPISNRMEEKGRGPPKGGQSSGRAGANWKPALPGAEDDDSAQVNVKRFAEVDKINEMDNQMGFAAFAVGPPRMGWMINMAPTYVKDLEWPGGRSAVDYYFLQEDGEYFKTTLVASPYLFIKCKMGTENVVEDALRKRFEKAIELIERVEKEDLDFPNHLAGLKRSYLKLSFRNVSDLDKVKRVLMPIAIRQGENYQDGVIPMTTEADFNQADSGRHKKGAMGTGDPHASALSNIVDLREHDVPYALRVSIDYNICVGLWYTVRAGAGGQRAQLTAVREKDVRPDPVILAYDIETSKSPLKFPDSAVDPIMMISYMINGQGFLITNRDIVSLDIEDFEYTPKPDFPGNFTVFNEPDESALLRRFFSHIQQTRPTVMVTYNGDFFDFPYVETRALVHGMDMEAMIGFKKNNQGDYWSTHCLHLDCYRWVKRDSYLPAGSQGLKAVTSAKLGYDPLELDPELMTPLATSDPQTLANYSVSDAVATFYLYMKYVHPFIFSLCNIIPLNPDDVLRKGSGTLCETLLMAEAYRANVVMPNKHADGKENFFAGHLVETETYIGGHVEALEAGVFRADIPYKFRLDPECLQTLIKDLDRALTFSLQAEGGIEDLAQVTNYDEIKEEIKGRLEMLRDNPHRNDQPLIYHLDVAAMYPNIILSNRLQPTAIVDESTCAQCDHNRPGKSCQRTMTWSWRGEVYTAKKNEYRMIKAQLESEQFPAPVNPRFAQANNGVTRMVPYHGLPEAEQKALLHKRLAEYSQKVYRRVRKTEVVQRESIVCQKEHAFYIDTVKAFRDRRYDYKGLHKKAKKMLEDAITANDAIKIEECKKLVVLYDSLQLAHKCILNSFYGYVMRKGARWYSMEMAGIVCATGASIIQLARQTVERIGRPLELDTDGIWAMLPWDFPQSYTFKLASGKQHAFDYPCVMLNHQVHDMFTNDQYHTLIDPVAGTYKQSSENSIFFEIDGPYRAMIIPSSTEEGKLLKKRYAVFNQNGSLAELKGFEVKRRGELKFLKVFQTQIFKVYLEGKNLAECYGKVAEVADYWLDILHGHGKALEDHDLIDLISENRSMSKSLEEYGEQKSTSISTARRLAEFLGDAMVKEKGLACKFVISSKPIGIPVAQRAIPLAIFSTDEPVMKHYLRKWLKDPGLTDFDMRSIIDWSYYLERLGSMIQKLIVIPAALQAVPNPVTRVPAPDWLLRKDKNGNGLDAKVQAKITDVFKKGVNRDIEDLLKPSAKPAAADETKVEVEIVPTPAPVALMDIDYSAWIAGTKAHWQHLRANLGDRLNSAVTTTATTSTTSANKSAFGRLAEHDKDLVTRTPWQIISVEALGPGEFKLWVLLASPQARSFHLSMLRTLYFHLSCPLESLEEADSLSALLHRVYRKLPTGEDAQFLYEFSLPESTFKEHFYRFASLTQLPNLLGVYEDDVPLDLMALASLGSCVSVKSDVRRHRDAHSRYALDDFAFCSTTDVPYLSKENIHYVSVLQFASDTRQLILLGLPAGHMRLLIVEPGMRRQLPSNLRSLLPPDLAADSGVLLEADMFPDQAAAQKSILRSITELVDSRTGPVIVLQHSSILSGRTATPLGLDESSLPVLPINSLPDVASETLFPALDWQRTVGRRALAHQMALGPWLEHRLSLARYSHLPLGFLLAQEDSFVYARVADVFFTRALRRAGHLLWYNHGSTEKASLVKADSTLAHESDEAAPSQKCSGLFRTVCVEADLTGLAINAVMEHASIAAEDQAVGATIVAGATGLGLSSSSQSSLLGIVKKLLTGWLRDHVQNGQEHAQHLATGLHSWLQASSHLHSPSLARRLRSLLNRSLGLLVARLHSFGGQVVHIDSSRIVVRTTRQERAAAFALLEWIQRELKKQDAFCWIDFTPVRYWQSLLWMDSANYHGLAFTAPIDQEECQAVSGEETTWLMEWSLAEYLPSALQPIFKRLVQEFIHRATSSALAAEDPVNRRESLIPSTDKIDEADDDELSPGDSEFAQLFLRVLREAQRYFFSTNPQGDSPERCFPPLVGSRLAAIHGSTHPSPRAALLEFVKACGAVFALDQEHPRQAEHLMKLAHGLLGIRSFADETLWKMPAPSLLLPDIICPACTRTANLDLCRDLAIAGSKPGCRVCTHIYDPADLEAALTTQLTSLLSSYLSQDLVCKHCPPGVGLKADHMQPICLRCASPFQLATIKPDQVKEHIQILKRLVPGLGMSALSCYLSNLSI